MWGFEQPWLNNFFFLGLERLCNSTLTFFFSEKNIPVVFNKWPKPCKITGGAQTWNSINCVKNDVDKTPSPELGGGFKCLLFSPLPGEMIQFDWYFSNWLVQPPASESKELVQTFHVVSLLDLSFPPLKGGMMHYGRAAASGTTTAGGVLIFRRGEDKPKIFSQFLLFKKNGEFGCGKWIPWYHLPQKKFTQQTNTLLWSPRTYLLEKAIFFSHFGWAQFLGCLDCCHFRYPPGGQRSFGSFQEFPWKFPDLPVWTTGRWRSYIASTHPECGQTLCRDLCKEFPTRAQSRGRCGWWVVGGWWVVVETPLEGNPISLTTQSDGQWTAQFRFLWQF